VSAKVWEENKGQSQMSLKEVELPYYEVATLNQVVEKK